MLNENTPLDINTMTIMKRCSIEFYALISPYPTVVIVMIKKYREYKYFISHSSSSILTVFIQLLESFLNSAMIIQAHENKCAM